jgi:alpha-D-xyloside xylohydrolase
MYTGKHFEGGQSIKAEVNLERMPVYVKEGSIIPLGPDLQYTSEKLADTISLLVYTGRNASFELYEDEGTTYDYEKGAFATIPFTYNEKTKSLLIGERKGSFTGMLNKRIFRIRVISSQKASGIDATNFDKEITYDGKKQVINLHSY